MKFEVNVGPIDREQKVIIDADGDLHFLREDGSTFCITQQWDIFEYTAEEFEQDITVDETLYEGDSITIHL